MYIISEMHLLLPKKTKPLLENFLDPLEHYNNF